MSEETELKFGHSDKKNKTMKTDSYTLRLKALLCYFKGPVCSTVNSKFCIQTSDLPKKKNKKNWQYNMATNLKQSLYCSMNVYILIYFLI